MHSPSLIDPDLWFLRELRQELKNLYALNDADAERLIQNSIIPKRLATDPYHVHHDAPIYWAQFIGNKNQLQAKKPL